MQRCRVVEHGVHRHERDPGAQRARQAHVVLRRRDELRLDGARTRGEPLDLGVAIAVMIGESRGLDDLGAERLQRGEELLRSADAGEGDDAAPAQPLRRVVAARSRARTSGACAARIPASCTRSSPIRTNRSASASPCATGTRNGPAGSTRPFPNPVSPSITTMRSDLTRVGFCSPSSMTITSAPARTALSAPAGRSRATIVGATAASRSGSSPTWPASCASGSTAIGPARLPP
jgi:hypothetical protein